MQNLPSVYTFPKTSPGKVLCKHTASVADNGVAFAIMRHSTLVTNDLPLVIQPQPLSYERPKYLAAPGIFAAVLESRKRLFFIYCRPVTMGISCGYSSRRRGNGTAIQKKENSYIRSYRKQPGHINQIRNKVVMCPKRRQDEM